MKTRIYSFIAFFALLTLSFAPTAFGGSAGSILGWGEQVVDSTELAGHFEESAKLDKAIKKNLEGLGYGR